MDNSTTLSSNVIWAVIIIIVIIIIIIILVAIFNDNNNNNNNPSPTQVINAKKQDTSNNTKVPDETQDKLNKILDGQKRQIEMMSNILDSTNDSSVDNTLSDISSNNRNNRNNNNKYKSNVNNNVDKGNVNKPITYTASLKPPKIDDDEDDDDKEVKIYYHDDEELNTSEIEKLGLDKDNNFNMMAKKENPPSIDYQHQSFSDTTEHWEAKSSDDPSFVKKEVVIDFSDILDEKNQKTQIVVNDKKGNKKDVKKEKKRKIPLPGVANRDQILNSDMSSPDDDTISRVGKKIPLPKDTKK
jgi:hypothetical protein